jgi:SpoVK/Ycf46/Vps4 family AAA+-type ATPase
MPSSAAAAASKVYVGTPSVEERADMVTFFLKDIEHRLDTPHREAISVSTEGWSGSEIQSLCREAGKRDIQ